MDIPYTVKPREDTGLYNAKLGIWLFLASEVMLFGALFSSYILLRVNAEFWPHNLLNVPIGTFNTFVLIASSVTVVLAWANLKMHNYGKFKLFMGLTILCAMGFVGIKSFEYRDKWTHYTVWFKDAESATKIMNDAYGENGIEKAQKVYEHTFGEYTKGGRPAKAEPLALRLTGHIEGNPWFLNLAKLALKKEDHVMFVADPPPGVHEHGKPFKIETANIKRLSAYVPSHSTYFAIYFTMTALHALHVIGGAIVLGYMWLCCDDMWKTNPERLTNRIEVGGLFWHFVDLVWIFLFPVLYLL